MSSRRLPARKMPVPQAAPAKGSATERPPEKAKRARAQAGLEPREHLDAVQRRRQRVREARAELRRRWPMAFATPVPLAVGMDTMIRAEMPERTTSRLKE